MNILQVMGLCYKLAPLFLGHKTQPQQFQQSKTVLTGKDVALCNLRNKKGAVILVIGTRDTGKTELCYRIAEFLGKPNTYAISPEQKPHPAFIERIELADVEEKVKPGSTVIFDDVPVYMSSKDYYDQLVRTIEKMIPMVRHDKKLHLIFSAQSSGLADKYVLDADAIFIKPGSLLFEDLERTGMKKLYQIANPYFGGKDDDWVKHHCYLVTRQWQGVISITKTS